MEKPREKVRTRSLLVVSMSFWDILEDCLRASQPIMQVLRLVDSDEKLVMGYIAQAIGKAVIAIKEKFRNRANEYEPILTILDRQLNMHFSRPSCGARAFLNPVVYYNERDDPKSKVVDVHESSFQDCVEVMVKDKKERMEIMLGVEDYK